MPAITAKGVLLVAIELVCGAAIGAILMATLFDAIEPLIIFVIVLATIVAILDFANYMPAFSVAYFAGYLAEFLHPFASVLGDLKIPVLILAIVGIGFAVAVKAAEKKAGPAL
ncbi:MAG TPA: hypothetical protein VMB35_04920 [Methanomicrobiales archaeon]|nr:hypothetical protein [Methanomicrobiales archaeon]